MKRSRAARNEVVIVGDYRFSTSKKGFVIALDRPEMTNEYEAILRRSGCFDVKARTYDRILDKEIVVVRKQTPDVPQLSQFVNDIRLNLFTCYALVGKDEDSAKLLHFRIEQLYQKLLYFCHFIMVDEFSYKGELASVSR